MVGPGDGYSKEKNFQVFHPRGGGGGLPILLLLGVQDDYEF